jgi:hypothetical protein
MKKTIETMNRATGETMEKRLRIVRNFRATELSITAQGLAIGGYADYEPLSVSGVRGPYYCAPMNAKTDKG